MTATIIWGTDFGAKRTYEASLEQQSHRNHQHRIARLPCEIGPTIYIDTSPSEYSAPLDDPA
jgi:hypothetical protein